MGKPFQKVHASIVGKFEHGVGEKIPQWIRANGGQFSRDVNARVTHLIATKEAFKSHAAPVETAKKLGTVKIVAYDWLEDSLLSNTRRPKPEGPYLLKNLMKPEKKVTPKSTKVVKETPKRRIADPFLGSKGKKATTLFRPSKPPATSREKYQLTLFESITEPHTYSTYAKFSRVGTSNVELLAGPRCKLELAVEKFKQFFKDQTAKEWDDRANGKMPPPKKDPDGNSLPVHEGWFYLEEKTTILGAFLREPQSTGCEESTGHIAYDGIKENDIEEKMANHQVEDGDEDEREGDVEGEGKDEDEGEDEGVDGSEADEADDDDDNDKVDE